MAPLKPLTDERLAELKESARYANSHGGGYVSVPANDLLTLLPADAEPIAVAAEPDPVADKPAGTVAVATDAHAEQKVKEIHEKSGVETVVENGIPEIVVPPISEPGPTLVAEQEKPADAEPKRAATEDGI